MASNFPATGLDTYATLTDNSDDVLAAHQNDRGDAIEAIEVKLGVDDSAVATSIDYFLKHASGTFKTHDHDGSDAAAIPLNNLDDVTISSPTNQQYLRYNSSTAKWENYTFTMALSDLSDMATAGATSNCGIMYNGSSWEDGFPNATYAA